MLLTVQSVVPIRLCTGPCEEDELSGLGDEVDLIVLGQSDGRME
jgi:hypothetical protein